MRVTVHVQISVIAFLLVIPSLTRAQETTQPKSTWREKADGLQAKLDAAQKEILDCAKTVSSKTEEIGLLKIALANGDKERLLSEGRLAGVRETVDRLEKENKELRQKNIDLEFAMARYSWGVAGEALALMTMAVVLVIISFRLRKRRPQS